MGFAAVPGNLGNAVKLAAIDGQTSLAFYEGFVRSIRLFIHGTIRKGKVSARVALRHVTLNMGRFWRACATARLSHGKMEQMDCSFSVPLARK